MGVTLKAPVADPKNYTDIVVQSIHFERQGSTGCDVTITVFGDDGAGNPLAGTRTTVYMRVPDGAGAPDFEVSGHAIDRGLSPSWTLTRAAALTNIAEIFTKADALVSNGLG